MSFYRNFTDKDDILRYYIDTETGKWLESSDINYLTADNPQVYVIFLPEHLYQYRDVIDTMMRDGKMYLLEAEFDKRFRAILSDVFDPWYIAFTIGGFYKLFCYWAESGYEKTPQEIAEYVKATPHNPCASDVKSVFFVRVHKFDAVGILVLFFDAVPDSV